jgi:hypothetical protein
LEELIGELTGGLLVNFAETSGSPFFFEPSQNNGKRTKLAHLPHMHADSLGETAQVMQKSNDLAMEGA